VFIHPVEVKCYLRVSRKFFSTNAMIVIIAGIGYFSDGFMIGKPKEDISK